MHLFGMSEFVVDLSICFLAQKKENLRMSRSQGWLHMRQEFGSLNSQIPKPYTFQQYTEFHYKSPRELLTSSCARESFKLHLHHAMTSSYNLQTLACMHALALEAAFEPDNKAESCTCILTQTAISPDDSYQAFHRGQVAICMYSSCLAFYGSQALLLAALPLLATSVHVETPPPLPAAWQAPGEDKTSNAII